MQRERLTFQTEMRVERRADEPPKIVGHGAVFNQETELFPGFREVVRPGAFSKTLREADVRALFNHDPNFILGRSSAGTLHLSEDDHGLRYEIDVDVENASIRDQVIRPMERGELTQSSFAFRVVKDEVTDLGDGRQLRELREVELFDVSPVTYPAYDGAEVQLRAAVALGRGDPATILAILRGDGLTDDEIRETMAKVVNSLQAPEPDPVIHSEALARTRLMQAVNLLHTETAS